MQTGFILASQPLRLVLSEMSNDNHKESRVKCPWCAEMIKPEALICPFCRSKLAEKNAPTSSGSETAKPGLAMVMFFNLLCPGLGAWKLGHRMRGLTFCLLTVVCLSIYGSEIVPKIQQEVTKAVRTGRTRSILQFEAELRDNQWLDAAFYLYFASFIDAFFLIKNTEPGERK